MRRWGLILVLAILLARPAPLFAQQQPPAGPGSAPQPAAPTYPGVAEVIPRLGNLSGEATQAEAKIEGLRETDSFQGPLQEAHARQEDLNRRIAKLGSPKEWSFDRLQEIRGRLAEQRKSLQKLLDALSARLSELDALGKEWNDRKSFWEGWRQALRKAKTAMPGDAFRRAERLIGEVLTKEAAALKPLVELQKEVTALQGKNQQRLANIDATLNTLRSRTFSKTAPSFANPAYYRQFNPQLWQALKKGVAQLEGVSGSYLQDYAWMLILQLLLALVLPLFILRHRQKAQETEEWQFLLHHPWATGVFVAVAVFGLTYANMPVLMQLVFALLAAVSASILIAALLRNPRKRFMVVLLATLFVISLGLQSISLPSSLYRLYLTLLSLTGIPLFLLLAARNRKAKGGRSDGFTLSLKLGALVLLISLLAQIGGYSTLSFRLIDSSISTVFLALFAAMAIRLGQGGIDFLLDLPFFGRWNFFRNFAEELTGRLKNLFQILVLAYTALYLLEVWNLYDTVGQAWSDLLQYGFTVGTFHLTVGMVLSAGLVLYLSLVTSWVVRAVLDAEVFPHKRFDRGVRDSIKKLLHYSFMFIGFLLAMSVAGVELKNFAVLAGAFGIGIGFGLQNIVNNFVSGLILLFERPVKLGDLIVLDGEWGNVRKIGLRSTVVETFDRSEIIVPNSQLISEKVTNWTLSTSVARVVVEVGVAYGSDLQGVLAVLQEAAEQHPDVLTDPTPSSIFTSFGDSSLNFELRVWISDVARRLNVKSEIGQFIDRRFREEGIEIPFPQRDLHLRSVEEALLGRFDPVSTAGRGAGGQDEGEGGVASEEPGA